MWVCLPSSQGFPCEKGEYRASLIHDQYWSHLCPVLLRALQANLKAGPYYDVWGDFIFQEKHLTMFVTVGSITALIQIIILNISLIWG